MARQWFSAVEAVRNLLIDTHRALNTHLQSSEAETVAARLSIAATLARTFDELTTLHGQIQTIADSVERLIGYGRRGREIRERDPPCYTCRNI
jgi:hypothetical protein